MDIPLCVPVGRHSPSASGHAGADWSSSHSARPSRRRHLLSGGLACSSSAAGAGVATWCPPEGIVRRHQCSAAIW